LVNPATKAWGTKAMVHQACTQGLLLIGVGDGVRHYLAQQAFFGNKKGTLFPLFSTTSSLDTQAVVPPTSGYYCYSYESLKAMRLTEPYEER